MAIISIPDSEKWISNFEFMAMLNIGETGFFRLLTENPNFPPPRIIRLAGGKKLIHFRLDRAKEFVEHRYSPLYWSTLRGTQYEIESKQLKDDADPQHSSTDFVNDRSSKIDNSMAGNFIRSVRIVR